MFLVLDFFYFFKMDIIVFDYDLWAKVVQSLLYLRNKNYENTLTKGTLSYKISDMH